MFVICAELVQITALEKERYDADSPIQTDGSTQKH